VRALRKDGQSVGWPNVRRRFQIFKESDDVERMRRACVLAAATLREVERMIGPGITTQAIDDLVHEHTLDHGAYPAPLNYPQPPTDPRNPVIASGAFPRSVCTSVNQVVCHGIPSAKQVLRDGDIVNVDVTSLLDGFYGDTSKTFCIGEVAPEAKRVVEAARHSLWLGISQVRAGHHTGDIGTAIEAYAEAELGMSVVREYCGHGIGRVFHADPQINHVRTPGGGVRMVAGMCFTIEPMINLGGWRTRLQDDKWTVHTADGALSAQFEHTIRVTREGCEVLTDPALIEGSEFDA
jgi:methionyl aminopeptidase